MKVRSTLLLIFSFLFFSLTVKSQSTDWTPVFLTANGNHVVNGVEAYFQKGTCNDQDVVFIKFVNTNSYAVNLEWYNAVFTTELSWIHKENDKKTVLVPAATSLNGACAGELMLTVDLSQFIQDASLFKRLSTVELIISAAN